MTKRGLLKIIVPVFLFAVGFVLTLAVIPKGKVRNENINSERLSIKDISGVSEGDIVLLPALKDLNNGTTIAFNITNEKYLFFIVFSIECPGCSKDTAFWKSLYQEAAKRDDVCLFLLSIDNSQDSVKKFTETYHVQDLPTLYDESGQATRNFEIDFVPQYLLLAANGRVVARWNGLNHYDSKLQETTEPAKFFERITD